MSSELLGTGPVARLLGVSATTVVAWARAGRIPVASWRPGVGPGGRYDAPLFRREDVERDRAGKQGVARG